MTANVLAGTGHRPDKLGGYTGVVNGALHALACYAIHEHKPTEIISGMALGWDMALAEAAIEMGKPFMAAIPFLGQESQWPYASQRRYHDILKYARYTIIVCEGEYSPAKMQERNKWMVDRCDAVLALWNGTKGGTANCLQYAITQNKSIINLWDIYAGDTDIPF